jgi:adenine-specific DNA methylase
MWWLWILAILIVMFGFVVFRGAPYVPSRKKELIQAFEELYPLGEDDLLVDIGSGDGVVLRQASAHGARAVGYELNPILVVISQWLSRSDDNVRIYLADFWRVQLPAETTVVYTFGESRDIVKMAQKVATEAERLHKPIAFISYGFAIPDVFPLKQVGAYYLYEFTSLQTDEA